MGRRSLGFQISETVKLAFSEHQNKHSLSRDKEFDKMSRVYSYSEKSNLTKFGKQWAAHMKAEGIKYARDIKVEHIESFLESKKNSCSNATLKVYASYARKISHLLNLRFKCKIDFKNMIVPLSTKTSIRGEHGEAIRVVRFSENDAKQVYSYLKDRKSLSKDAFYISWQIGARNFESVSLTPKSLVYENGRLEAIKIIGKGKRTRFVPLTTQAQRDYFTALAKGKSDNEKLVPILPDSASAGIRRAIEKLSEKNSNLKQYLEAKSTQHALRKNFACKVYQDTYSAALAKGDDKRTAERKGYEESMHQLGHSKSRINLRIAYLDMFLK